MVGIKVGGAVTEYGSGKFDGNEVGLTVEFDVVCKLV